MSALPLLVLKDLRRIRRNPWPWLIHVLLPLVLTGLIGLTFGRSSSGGPPGRISFAIVDEDGSPLTRFLLGSAQQPEALRHLDPVFLERSEALRRLEHNQLAAVFIIPAHFTRHYLSGEAPVRLELIKNPAQSIHPTVLQELCEVLVTGLNAAARVFRPELRAWLEVFTGHADYHQIARLMEQTGARWESLRPWLDPPRITYETAAAPAHAGGGARSNLFGHLLLGLTGMFLLFLAANGMSDLLQEIRNHTFRRYHTVQEGLLPFLTAKYLFTGALLLGAGTLLLAAGTILFGIRWQHLPALALLTSTYAAFAAGMMSLAVVATGEERTAGALNTVLAMTLGLAGGCAFPVQSLPAALRAHVTPWLPTAWYTETARNLALNQADTTWWPAVLRLMAAAVVMVTLTSMLARKRLRSGAMP